MVCQKCRAINPAEKSFCGECGARLEAMPAPVAVPGEDGAYYCARHKKVPTRVRCGRCDTPVCPKCAVYGPVGVRCKPCGRGKAAWRPRAVLHEAARGLDSPGARRTVWYLAVWYFVISIITGRFGGGRDA